MMMGSIDYQAVRRQTEKQKSADSLKLRLQKDSQPSKSSANLDFMDETESESEFESNASSPKKLSIPISESPNFTTTSTSSNRNTKTLSVLAKTLDRYSVSDRAGAAIASAVLYDFGIINKDDTTNIVDRHKVRRARGKKRLELVNAQPKLLNFYGLYFDGRKDKTLAMTDGRKRTVKEEHIVLIKEPGNKYVGHVTPASGSAKLILESILNYLQSSNVSLAGLEVIGSDGTNTNTGCKGGIISLLEQNLKRPLQWFICLLHENELPLRHLFEFLDGSTTGPRGFDGPIGSLLKDCEKMPIVKFSTIQTTFPAVDSKELSSDQKYLFDISICVSSGVCSEELSKRDPGKLVHSRWLTTANRILRLYVACDYPLETLVILATFVIKVYVPMWFAMKTQSSCIYGTQHIFKTIQLSTYLPKNLKDIVHKSIQRNGYFGHPENILLSMLWDQRKNIRQLAYLRILKARKLKGPKVRSFTIPNFNFGASEYYELVDCQQNIWTEPPITQRLSEEELKQIVENPETSVLSYITGYPCHSQAVERAVKSVTEASLAVCGPIRRDGLIRSKLDSRSDMPKFESKRDFFV